MIALERHIEILLLSNDCVIVPNLGGFMTHYAEARYDEEDATFLPPRRTLGFNPQLTINDSLLALSYVEAYDISYPEAIHRIEEEVTELKSHLQNEGFYELFDLGSLSLNEDGNYVFTPCESGILTPYLYGLDSFEMPHAKVVPMNILPETADTPLDTAVDTLEETEQETDEDVVRIKFSWIRNAVAVAAVLLAIFLLALPTGKTEMMTRTISNLNNTILFGMMSKDTNMSKIDIHVKKDTVLKKDSAQKAEALPPATAAQADTVRQGYCIVLASYVTKKNAQLFVDNLQKKGYQESEVYVNRGITRVIYGHFQTADEAYQALRQVHHDKQLEEAWVYKFN